MPITSWAVTEYAVGDGRRVILNDDGTYEIVTDTIDTSVLAGRNFKIDFDSLIDAAMNYAIIEEPGLMLFGKDTLTSMLEELGIMDQILTEIPDVNFIFISSDRVLVLQEGLIKKHLSQSAYTIPYARLS